MDARSRTIVAALALLVFGACAQTFTPNSRRDAQDRWSRVRARMKCQLASETFASGHLDQASKHLQDALELDPALPEAHILRARMLLEKGETAACAEAVEEAVRNGADTPEADYLNGMVAQRYGDFTNALAWYERAARRDPRSAHYLASVAETLVSLGRAADALALVRERLTDFEQNATLRALVGGIYMMLDRYEEAADAYRDAARIAPDDVVLRQQLGTALVLAGRNDEAAMVLAPLGEAKEVTVSTLVDLGQAQLGLRKASEAKAVLQRAVDGDSRSARAWGLLAQAALEANDPLTARRAATRAAQLAPESREYRLLLAYVSWRQRDEAAARSILDDLIQGNPDDALARHMLERIRTTSHGESSRGIDAAALEGIVRSP